MIDQRFTIYPDFVITFTNLSLCRIFHHGGGMTKIRTKLIVSTIIITIGILLIAGAINTYVEAKTQIGKLKTQGDTLEISTFSGMEKTFVKAFLLEDGNIGFNYFAFDSNGVLVTSASCIADNSIFQGSGTSTLSINVDTTSFTLVNPLENPGECRKSAIAVLGQVSVSATGNGEDFFQSSGTTTKCKTFSGYDECNKTVGQSSSQSANVNSVSVLSVQPNLDDPSTLAFGKIGKTNTILQTWTVP